MKALSLLRFLFRNSTQALSRAGTAYFLAVYKVVITVSGPIWTSSVYKKRSKAEKAAGSTSGISIILSEVANRPLNSASKTALPMDRINL